MQYPTYCFLFRLQTKLILSICKLGGLFRSGRVDTDNVNNVDIPSSEFTDPLLFVGPVTMRGDSPVVVRITEKDDEKFRIRIHEPCGDNNHSDEQIDYILTENSNICCI